MAKSNQVPAQIHILSALMIVIGVIAIWLGWAEIRAADADLEPAFYFDPTHFNVPPYATIAVGFLTIAAAGLLHARLVFGPLVALAVSAMSLSRIIDTAPPHILDLSVPTDHGLKIWLDIFDVFTGPGLRWNYFLLAGALFWFMWRLVVSQVTWLRLKPTGAPNGCSAMNWLRLFGAFILAALSWLLIRYIGFFGLITTSLEFSDISETVAAVFHPLAHLDAFLPFLVAGAIFVFLTNERVDVDDSGVRLSLAPAGWVFWSAPWRHVGRIDIIRRGSGPSSAVIKYRWWFVPLTFVVHAKRYVGGEGIVEEIRARAQALDIEVTEWRVFANARWLAALFVAAGVLAVIYMYHKTIVDWTAFAALELPPPNFKDLANPVFYGGLSALSMCFFGAALGALSAHHQAGPRPVLLAFWIVAAALMAPSPLITWLVWIAVFSIYLGTRGQGIGMPVSHPTIGEWDLGFMLSSYSAIWSAVVYVLVILLLCRRARDSSPPPVP